MSQSLLSSSSSSFISLHAGGQHVVCRPEDPETLIELMSRIWDVECACDVRKPTPSMAQLASHLRRLSPRSPTPKGGLCFRHVCCDIADAWDRACAGGKAHVLAGFSNKGGTLVLAFVRTEHDTGVVEVNCKS